MGAHFLYVSNVLAHAEANAKISGKFNKQVADLKAAVAQEDAALKVSRKSLLTDDIAKADSERDTLYAVYKKIVQSLVAVSDENVANAAKVLSQHVTDYNIDTRAQLDKETGLLTNFIDDLENKFPNDVAAIGLGVIVTLLKTANEKVRRLTSERTDEITARPVGNLKASRKASDTAYLELVKMVNAYSVVEGEADYADFINYMNTEIAHYKREVLGHRSASPEADDEQE